MLERMMPSERISDQTLTIQWIENTAPFLSTRNQIINDLGKKTAQANNDEVTLAEMKTPAFLLDTMKRWADEGPLVLGSYSHPEQFDLYTPIASINLSLYLQSAKDRGIITGKEPIEENWYETVMLDRTITAPLGYGEIFPIKTDLLGLERFNFGSREIDIREQLRQLSVIDTNQVAQTILDRLSHEVLTAISEINPTKAERKIKLASMARVLSSRLDDVLALAEHALQDLEGKNLTVNDFLIEFEQKFFGFVLSKNINIPSVPKLSKATSIEGKLLSKNTKFLNLVFDTLDLLEAKRGPDILKNLVDTTGEGLFFGIFNGKEAIISVDVETNEMILIDKSTGETIEVFKERQVLDFVRKKHFLPLAKAEMLAVIAGGVTFHMGSERGVRERAIKALGINPEQFPEFSTYLRGLRIGGDVEQGNTVIEIEGIKRPIPPILAFVLLGREALSLRMLEKAGCDIRADKFTTKEFKTFCAKELVKTVTETNSAMIGGPPWS